ncbi:Carboxypeptidase A4 [Dinochytrium kinnereticum]|nr:Carboxypeptidase A4 [Dinochytrium kinnereticum]
MVSFTKLATLLVAGASAVSAALPTFSPNLRYKNNKVYRFNVQSVEHAELVQAVLEKYANLDIDNWSHSLKGDVDIRIPDAAVSALKQELFDVIPNTIFISDVQARLDEERAFMSNNSFKLEQMLAASPEAIVTAAQVFSDYQDLSTLVAFFQTLPGGTQFSIGKSHLGADIPGFKFGTGPKSIVFHGGIHAREWISPAVTTYLANFLATDPAAAKFLSLFTFHIIPVLNVDGYAYTRSNDRLWRKNRQPNAGSSCVGTDPNRNWNYAWSKPGASGSACSDTFYGSAPFSAPEPKAMSNYITSLGNVVSYIDFHSYSQLWLFPNGYSCSVLIKDYASVKAAGDKAVAALKAINGKTFTNGDSCNTIYQASGSSIDWAYNVANVTYTYTVELRDTGTYGFQLPANQIIPSGQETQAGVVALWEYVAAAVYGSPTTTITTQTSTVSGPTSTVAPPVTTTTTASATPTTTVAPCAHDKCVQGVALKAACDSCVSQIIAADPYCGSTRWDSICVGQVKSVCAITC